MDKLKRIYDTFVSSGRFISATPYGSGHINDTYLVKVDEDVEYILQRINDNSRISRNWYEIKNWCADISATGLSGIK